MTAQIHEKLIIDGQNVTMAFCPPLPKDNPRVTVAEPDEETGYTLYNSTACWRRYEGTWEIRDNAFYLVNLNGCYRLRGEAPLLADWFSGTLRIPQGKMLEYVHMGFGSVFEGELHLRIENGKVIDSRTIDNRDKAIVARKLGRENLPGSENRFEGDDNWGDK